MVKTISIKLFGTPLKTLNSETRLVEVAGSLNLITLRDQNCAYFILNKYYRKITGNL